MKVQKPIRSNLFVVWKWIEVGPGQKERQYRKKILWRTSPHDVFGADLAQAEKFSKKEAFEGALSDGAAVGEIVSHADGKLTVQTGEDA